MPAREDDVTRLVRAAPRYHLACPPAPGRGAADRSSPAGVRAGPPGSTRDLAVPFFRRLPGDGRFVACVHGTQRVPRTAKEIRTADRVVPVHPPRASADALRVSTPQPGSYPDPSADAFASSFAQPVNQFGTPSGQRATDPFGPATPAGGWSTPVVAPPAARTSRVRLVAVVGAVLLLAVGGFLAKRWYFPDLTSSISLPATVGVLSQGAGAQNGVTIQVKDAQGHARAVAMYVDAPVRPQQVAMVVAARGRQAPPDVQLPAGLDVSRIGKYTCSRDLTTADLVQASAQAQQNLTRTGLSSAAVCWRSSRGYTVMGMAFTGGAPAATLALQAATAGWD